MASWNEKLEGDQLSPCPICAVDVCKKKHTLHIVKCYEKNSCFFDDWGLIKCPLYNLHIMPKKYLNHHLDGNCEEALNMLRKYFQKVDLQMKIRLAPEDFLSDVPDELLNQQNKQLLFILRRDLEGNDLNKREDLYPDG